MSPGFVGFGPVSCERAGGPSDGGPSGIVALDPPRMKFFPDGRSDRPVWDSAVN